MGVVVFCHDRSENRSVALKTFKSDYLNQRGSRMRFLEEATNWIFLGEHPNIVTALRAEEVGSPARPYLVLAQVGDDPGKDVSLLGMIHRRRNHPLSFRRALQITADVACAMAYATERIAGLVHRDLKPGNILIEIDGRARVTDFGLARSFSEVDPVKWQETIQGRDLKDFRPPGTARYAAPELWKPETIPDPRADIYSLGLILYELITGQRAVSGKDEDRFHEIHCSGKLAPIPEALPRRIADLIQNCTALDREARYKDWSAVEDAVAGCYHDITGEKPGHFLKLPVDQSHQQQTNARSYLAIGASYENLGHPELAERYFTPALEIAKASGDRLIQMQALQALSLSLAHQQRHDDAISASLKGLQMAREDQDPALTGNLLALLGNLYARTGKHQQALNTLQEALALARDEQDHEAELATLGNLANAYGESGQVEKAINAYLLLLKQLQELNDQVNVANCQGNLGAAYLAAGKPEKGIEHLEQALGMAEQHADALGCSHALKHLCNAHAELNEANFVCDYAQKYLQLSQEFRNTHEQEWAQGMLDQWCAENLPDSSDEGLAG
jgi:serine/threonine protein kinase